MIAFIVNKTSHHFVTLDEANLQAMPYRLKYYITVRGLSMLEFAANVSAYITQITSLKGMLSVKV
jgi:hypothetical protein